jgi:hypothetical protein
MGIQVEFNPDLALRNISEFNNGNRKREECIPDNLQAGQEHEFLKQGLRNYWLGGELPLVETKGNQQMSKPVASVIIREVTHIMIDGEPFTKGRFKVVDVFDPDDSKINFDGFYRIK